MWIHGHIGAGAHVTSAGWEPRGSTLFAFSTTEGRNEPMLEIQSSLCRAIAIQNTEWIPLSDFVLSGRRKHGNVMKQGAKR